VKYLYYKAERVASEELRRLFRIIFKRLGAFVLQKEFRVAAGYFLELKIFL